MRSPIYTLIFLMILMSNCSRKIGAEFKDKIHFELEIPDNIQEKSTTMYVNAPEGLRVRNSPCIEGDRIALLDDLTEVLVIKEEKNNVNIDGIIAKWTFIEAGNIQGWVFGGYLSSEPVSSRQKNTDQISDSTIAVSSEEVVINMNSVIASKSIAVIDWEGKNWFIGQSVSDDVIKISNTMVSSTLFGVQFGPLNGYVDDDIKIGWNNRNRIIYIELLSFGLQTIDGIKLGDSREKVLNVYGLPYRESQNEYRYRNIDFEVIGIIFQFIDDRVSKIILFTYT